MTSQPHREPGAGRHGGRIRKAGRPHYGLSRARHRQDGHRRIASVDPLHRLQRKAQVQRRTAYRAGSHERQTLAGLNVADVKNALQVEVGRYITQQDEKSPNVNRGGLVEVEPPPASCHRGSTPTDMRTYARIDPRCPVTNHAANSQPTIRLLPLAEVQVILGGMSRARLRSHRAWPTSGPREGRKADHLSKSRDRSNRRCARPWCHRCRHRGTRSRTPWPPRRYPSAPQRAARRRITTNCVACMPAK